ncbi:MAG: MFS transporter [Actinobacteria bacterium]|nr:MFS transporter [Actinomycetota bacterium]
MLNRILDESYPTETRQHVVALTVARLNANACFRFAPPFLASISDDFDVSLGRLGIALMITEFTMIVAPCLGSIVDRLARRTSMAGGLLGVTAATALAASSPNLVVFTIAIAVLGASKLVFDVGLTAWINDHVDYERRGRVVGITETSWALGLLLGVTIMGLVASATSWRWGYVAGAAGTAIMTLVVASRLRDDEVRSDTSRRDENKAPMPSHGWWVVGSMFFLMAASQCMFVTFGSWLEDEFGFDEARIAAVAFGLGAFELLASITSARRTDVWGKERSTALGAALIVPTGLLFWVGHTNEVSGLVLLALFLLGFEFAIVSLLPLAANAIPESPGRGLGFAIGGGTMGRAVMSFVATATYDAHGIEVPATIGAGCALLVIVCLRVHSVVTRVAV